MIGLDTNVLVRYLVQDDPAQSRKANELIAAAAAAGERLHVDVVVVCELVWVLLAAYRLDRITVADALDKMLDEFQLSFDDRDLVRSALTDFRRGPGDFADYLIGARARRAGCSHTVTFDRGLKKSALFRVL